ncbi:hypothetical protein KCU83_g617, partial [Aureobasidium melanogenum]
MFLQLSLTTCATDDYRRSIRAVLAPMSRVRPSRPRPVACSFSALIPGGLLMLTRLAFCVLLSVSGVAVTT